MVPNLTKNLITQTVYPAENSHVVRPILWCLHQRSQISLKRGGKSNLSWKMTEEVDDRALHRLLDLQPMMGLTGLKS